MTRNYFIIPSASSLSLFFFPFPLHTLIPPRFPASFQHFTTKVVLHHSNYLQEIGLPIRSKSCQVFKRRESEQKVGVFVPVFDLVFFFLGFLRGSSKQPKKSHFPRRNRKRGKVFGTWCSWGLPAYTVLAKKFVNNCTVFCYYTTT